MATTISGGNNLIYSKCENERCTGQKNTILTAQEIKQKLLEVRVDVIKPESDKEEIMADAFDNFSSLILEEEQEKCQEILESHMNKGLSIGELQGGSDEHTIYRRSITDDDNNEDVVTELLSEFYSSYRGKKYSSILTIKKLKQ